MKEVKEDGIKKASKTITDAVIRWNGRNHQSDETTIRTQYLINMMRCTYFSNDRLNMEDAK